MLHRRNVNDIRSHEWYNQVKRTLYTDSRHLFYHRTSKLENQRQIPKILDMILQGPLY